MRFGHSCYWFAGDADVIYLGSPADGFLRVLLRGRDGVWVKRLTIPNTRGLAEMLSRSGRTGEMA